MRPFPDGWVRPGNPRVVHHVLNFLDVHGQGRALDAKDPGPGYTSFGGPGARPSAAWLRPPRFSEANQVGGFHRRSIVSTARLDSSDQPG